MNTTKFLTLIAHCPQTMSSPGIEPVTPRFLRWCLWPLSYADNEQDVVLNSYTN